jgi:hypothetical protein
MERIRNSISKELPPLRLYLDDVRELHEFVRESAEEVTLSAGGYRLENSDELRQLPRSCIHDLQVSAYRPYINVRLTKVSAEVYVGSGDVEAEGIAARLEAILLNARAKVYLLPSYFWPGLIAAAPFWVGVFLKSLAVSAVGIALLVAWLALLAIDFRFRTMSYCTVIPVVRKDEANFWKRNKDHIVLLVIGAIIGSFVTVLVKAMVGLF